MPGGVQTGQRSAHSRLCLCIREKASNYHHEEPVRKSASSIWMHNPARGIAASNISVLPKLYELGLFCETPPRSFRTV
jgi:hypothetical protein